MRRLVSALTLGMLVAGLMAAPVLAKAEKVDLIGCPINGITGGGGAVVFNNSSGPNNLKVTVQLKNVTPDTVYDVYVFVDGGWYGGALAGTVTTNGVGNATFHMNGALIAGTHYMAIDVVLKGSSSDVYETPGIHASPFGIPMTFE